MSATHAGAFADRQWSDTTPLPFSTLTRALQHWSSVSPHALALTSGRHELTYAELLGEVEACEAWLQREGVQPGDRVVIVGGNSLAWVINYLAIMARGAIVVPANNRLNASQFADQVELLDARLVISDESHEEVVSLVPPHRRRPLAASYPKPEWPSVLDPDPDSCALISFTSGTTGRPKGAMLSNRALAEASWAFVRVLGTEGIGSTLVVVPMFHNTGFIDQFGYMLLVGGRTDLLEKFRTAAAIQAMSERPVQYLAAVPSIIRLLMLADGAQQAFEPMATLLYGGSPMPAAWIDEAAERWPHLRLFHGYGLTEYGSAISFLPPQHARERGESVGFPVPGTTVRIVDEAGEPVSPGAVGELLCQGPTMMAGYWRQPELTAQKITDGWLRTGDLARVDDGFYYIEGRIDDVINRGGEKVLPAHVESELSQLPGIAQSCVFGVADPILQFRVWAAVEERPGEEVDVDRVLEALRERLPDYAVPERLLIRAGLPRTASGKIDRKAIAAEAVAD